MGSASRTVNPDSITFPAGGDAGVTSANAADLNSKFSTGNIVEAVHVNKLRSMLNNALAHYHNYPDMYSSKTYGNTGHSGNLTESKNTGAPVSKPSDVSSVSIGEVIEASRFNQYANVSRYIHSHKHSITDRTG